MTSALFTSLLAGIVLIRGSIAGYALTDDFSQNNFFGNFEAFTGDDPTNGFVEYLDYPTATRQGLIGTAVNDGAASYLGVDSRTEATTTGRQSVRISTNQTWNHGLFIADIVHMPGGQCGTWPAFWLLGSGTWPAGGEIDIIEGANNQQADQSTLHTSAGCSVTNTGFSGKMNATNCGVGAPGEGQNQGCQIMAQDEKSYGSGFNAAGGGVYATEWTSDYIAIYFWSRDNIPSDVSSGSPDPSTWGNPYARFAGACDIDQHFKDMQIIFDMTFCGDWAGKDWEGSGCAASTGTATCEAYVKANPGAFKDAYWLVNSVRVYEEGGNVGTSTTNTAPAKKRLARSARFVEYEDLFVADDGIVGN